MYSRICIGSGSLWVYFSLYWLVVTKHRNIRMLRCSRIWCYISMRTAGTPIRSPICSTLHVLLIRSVFGDRVHRQIAWKSEFKCYSHIIPPSFICAILDITRLSRTILTSHDELTSNDMQLCDQMRLFKLYWIHWALFMFGHLNLS